MRPIFFFLLWSTFLLQQSCTQSKKTTESKPPNIVFLLADDLGYGELGCYGQEIVKTPNLDQLAKDGMRFTDFYAGNAVCSPSRAVLMTGKRSDSNTIRGNLGITNNDELTRIALRPDELTLGDMLKKKAYQTAFIGKWHLGSPEDLSTWAYNRGFDFAAQEQWGKKNTNNNATYTQDMEYINGVKDSVFFDYTKWNSKDEFRTSLAFDYLDRKEQDKSFFLFMSYRAPHGHERVIGNETLYADKGWPENERIHAAKITLLDTQIGKLMKKLESMGELDNTIILFTSDNGPTGEGHDYEFFNSNGELRGYKRDLYEGGIKVPLIAYWKNHIQPGSVSNFVSGFQDIMPTLAEITQSAIPNACNGMSILPELLGKPQNIHPYLNWEILVVNKRKTVDKLFRQSVRIDEWKGVRYGATYAIELYNLDTDPSETIDVAAEHPEIIAKMDAIFTNERVENVHYPFNGLLKE